MDSVLNFSASLNFSDIDKSAETAWSRAQNIFNKKPIKIKIEDNFSQPLGRITAGIGNFDRALDASTKRVVAFGVTAGIFAKIKTGFDAFLTSTIAVNDAITKIGVSLNINGKNLENFSSQLFNVARNSGQSFAVAAEAAQKLSRQGLGTAETLKRLNDALVLSRISGLDSAESVKTITSAMNSFQKEGLTSTQIIDKFAAAQNRLGISSDVFADAIERTGETAQAAGVNFNTLLGYISSIQTVTQRGGAAIGTTLGTIFEKLQDPSTREKLNKLGIATRNQKGDQLGGQEVLNNVAKSFVKNPNSDVNRNILESIAGSRQENNAIALLNDLAKANGVVAQSYEKLGNAQGEAEKINGQYNTTLLSLIQNTKTSFTQLGSNIGNQAIGPGLKGITNLIGGATKFLTGGDNGKGVGKDIGNGLLQGISDVVAGPGAAFIGLTLGKAILKALKFAGTDLKDILGINSATQQRIQLQTEINSLLNQATEAEKKQYFSTNNIVERTDTLVGIQARLTKEYELQAGFVARIAELLAVEGVSSFKSFGEKGIPNHAGGYLGAVSAEIHDISAGVGGATSSAKPVLIPSFNFGGGRVGPAVANTDEYFVKNFSSGGGDAVFNRNMVAKMGLPSGAVHLSKGHIPNYASGDFDPSFEYGKLRRSSGAPLKKTDIAELNELFDKIKSAATATQGKDFKGKVKEFAEGLNEASKKLVLETFKKETTVETRSSRKIKPEQIFNSNTQKKLGEEGASAARSGNYKGTGSRTALEYESELNQEAAAASKASIAEKKAEAATALKAAKAAEVFSGKLFALSLALPFLIGGVRGGLKSAGINAEEGGTIDKTISTISTALEDAITGFFVGGPWGALVGSVFGGITGYIGSASKQKTENFNEKYDDDFAPSKNNNPNQKLLPLGAFSKYDEKIGASFRGSIRNGGLPYTGAQRAQNYLDFYANLSKESGLDESVLREKGGDNGTRAISAKNTLTDINASKYAANFLQGINPGGQYLDSRENPLNLNISQGLDIASRSSDIYEATEAKTLKTLIEDARKSSGQNQYGAPIGSVGEDGLVVGQTYSTNDNKVTLSGRPAGVPDDRKQFYDAQVQKLEEATQKLKDSHIEHIHKFQIEISKSLENRGYDFEKGLGGDPNSPLDLLIKGVGELVEKVNKLQGSPSPPSNLFGGKIPIGI